MDSIASTLPSSTKNTSCILAGPKCTFDHLSIRTIDINVVVVQFFAQIYTFEVRIAQIYWDWKLVGGSGEHVWYSSTLSFGNCLSAFPPTHGLQKRPYHRWCNKFHRTEKAKSTIHVELCLYPWLFHGIIVPNPEASPFWPTWTFSTISAKVYVARKGQQIPGNLITSKLSCTAESVWWQKYQEQPYGFHWTTFEGHTCSFPVHRVQSIHVQCKEYILPSSCPCDNGNDSTSWSARGLWSSSRGSA